MAIGPVPLHVIRDMPRQFHDWLRQLQEQVGSGSGGLVPWANIDTTGSNLTDLVTRLHSSLQSLQGGTSGEYYHLTSAQHTGLTAPPYTAGTFTIATGTYKIMVKRLSLTTTQRVTLAGTARLRIT